MKKFLSNIFGYSLTGLFFVLIAAVPIGGFYQLGKSIWYVTTYEKDTGVVVSCSSRVSKGRWTTKYASVVEMDDGSRITSKLYGSRESCYNKQGERVSVLLNPDNRDEAVINTFDDLWLMPLLLLSIPGLLLVSYIAKRFR